MNDDSRNDLSPWDIHANPPPPKKKTCLGFLKKF